MHNNNDIESASDEHILEIASTSSPLITDSANNNITQEEICLRNRNNESNIFSSAHNLCNTMMGTGLLVVPFLVSELGMFRAFILILILGTVGYITTMIIGKESVITGALTLKDVVHQRLGFTASKFVQICIIFSTIGGLTTYIIIIGDVLVGYPDYEGGIPYFLYLITGENMNKWYISRWFIILIVELFFLLPLLSKENLTSLACVSIFANSVSICLIILLSILVCESVTKKHRIGFVFSPAIGLHRETYQEYFIYFFSFFATMLSSFIAHSTVPSIVYELKNISINRMRMTTATAYTMSVIFYVTIGILSYLIFGLHVQENILSNFSLEYLNTREHKIIGSLVTILFAFKILLVFPLVHWPLRENISDIIYGNPRVTGLKAFSVNFANLAIMYGLAMILNSIEIALSLIGCTSVMAVGLLIPSLLIMKNGDRDCKKIILAVFLMIFGIALFISGAASILKELILLEH